MVVKCCICFIVLLFYLYFMKKLLFLIGFLCTNFLVQSQNTNHAILNEIQTNNTLLEDNTGNKEDWIEIYNPTTTTINLAGYYISDDKTNPARYQLPSNSTAFTIPPAGFLLLWASGYPNRGTEHLGFQLNSDSGTVLLSSPSGILVDSIQYLKQKKNTSYGRIQDGVLTNKFFIGGTPNASNNTLTSYVGFLEAPAFSLPSGFYAASFNLNLTTTNGATIYYSTDGSEPSPGLVGGITYNYKNEYPSAIESPVGATSYKIIQAFQYQTPITIIDASNNPNNISAMTSTLTPYDNYKPNNKVAKGTVVRARNYKTGYIPSDIITNTYFITNGGTNPYQLPVTCITTAEPNLFDVEDGLYVPGKKFEDWRSVHPADEAYSWVIDANFYSSQQQYPLSMELFETQSTTRTLQRDAGFEIKGSSSATGPRKSIGIYFKNKYSTPTLGYPIFQAQGNTRTDFAHLVFRAGNDGSLLNDMAAQTCSSHMNIDNLDGQYTMLFINGEFWGIYAIRERYNSDYFKQIYGIDKTNVDYIKQQINTYYPELGDNADYTALNHFVDSNDMANTANWEYVQSKIDIPSFIDIYVVQLFFANLDFPANNNKMFRKRVAPTLAPLGQDGKYRWLMLDADAKLPTDYNNLARCLDANATGFPNDKTSTVFFRKLLNQPAYKNWFINRFADELNTAFQSSVVTDVFTNYKNQIAPHFSQHRDRYNNVLFTGYGFPDLDWYTTDIATNWSVNRISNMRNFIETELSAGTQRTLSLDVSAAAAGYIHLNTIDLLPTTRGVSANPYPWTGKYFRNNKIKLEAKAKPGYVFSHWETNALYNLSTNPIIEEYVRTDFNTAKAIFVVDNTPVCNAKLIQYWNFNILPSGNLVSTPPTITQGNRSYYTPRRCRRWHYG